VGQDNASTAVFQALSGFSDVMKAVRFSFVDLWLLLDAHTSENVSGMDADARLSCLWLVTHLR